MDYSVSARWNVHVLRAAYISVPLIQRALVDWGALIIARLVTHAARVHRGHLQLFIS
jgi:hypothetical protein